MTVIQIVELHTRFSKKNGVARVVPVATEAPATEVARPTEAEVKIPRDRELAERQMLGILLKEPQRWHKVGLVMHPEDFGVPGHRKLAQTYWQHQQDVGEPAFSEFLG